MVTATHEAEIVDDDIQVTQIESADTLALLNSSEIDTQIATAKRYPRSIRGFMDEARQIITLSESVAADCTYALPRGGKTLSGPSVRFAEIIASSWGNCRAGARVVSEGDKFVTAQGVFLDLQKNTAISYEVKRRITDKYGNRYNDDMVGTTCNAACSIALRNAITRGIPQAIWKPLHEEAKQCAMGDIKTLPTKRVAWIKAFEKLGVKPEKVYWKLGVKGIEDITLEHILTLGGMYNAMKDGDTTADQLFSTDDARPGSKVRASDINAAIDGQRESHDEYHGAPSPDEFEDGYE